MEQHNSFFALFELRDKSNLHNCEMFMKAQRGDNHNYNSKFKQPKRKANDTQSSKSSKLVQFESFVHE